MKVGDVCRLKVVIPGSSSPRWRWRTGFYRVTHIYAPFCCDRDKDDPRMQVYRFDKIKKDGTKYKSFMNGYSCLAWDKMIEDGKVEICNFEEGN